MLTIILFSGCQARTNSKTQIGSFDTVDLTIEQEIDIATHILDAAFIDRAEDGAAVFQIVNLYKGEEADNVVRVYNTKSLNYKKGTKYVLLVEKNISVYYNYPQFVTVRDETISEDDANWDSVHDMISQAVQAGFKNSVNEYGVPFTDSTELEEVVAFSTNIFVVTVKEIYSKSTILPVETYVCDVKKCIKGSPEDNGQIMITFFNGTVEPGKDYVVLTGYAKETAPIYVLSSKSLSVLEATEADMIASMVRGG